MRLVLLVLLTVALQANARAVVELTAADFSDATQLRQMDPSKLYYTGKVLPFADWQAKFPDEAKALNLYNGFIEPEVVAVKYGIEKRVVEKMMVFIVQAKMLLKKSPQQLSLANFTKIDFIRKFDPELQQTQINPSQIVPLEVQQMASIEVNKRPALPNFNWCKIPAKDPKDTPVAAVTRIGRESDLSYLIPKGRPMWCSDSGRSICVESCYVFSPGYRAAVSAANAVLPKERQKDKSVAFQSEIRPFSTEQEAGSAVSLQRLTGINTPVRGGLEQNSFYFNQLFQYAKILGVIQDVPGRTDQSVATIYFAVGIKKRTWEENSIVQKVLMGESKGYLNTETGITAGLPVFTQTTLDAIGQILEN